MSKARDHAAWWVPVAEGVEGFAAVVVVVVVVVVAVVVARRVDRILHQAVVDVAVAVLVYVVIVPMY